MIDFGFGVTLGPLDSRYREHIRQWRNDSRVWQWCRQHKLISDWDQEHWFEGQARDPSIQMYAIVVENKIAGVCGFTSIDLINRRAEFSLYIDPELGGKGIATRAIKTLFAHGFRNWGFNSIWGETFDGNPAARLFSRIGMTKDGVRRQFYFRDGKFIDAHLYSFLSSEFSILFPIGDDSGSEKRSTSFIDLPRYAHPS